MEHNGEAMEINGEVIEEVMADMADNTECLLQFNNQDMLPLMLILMLDMVVGEAKDRLMVDMVDTEDMEDTVDMDIHSIIRV